MSIKKMLNSLIVVSIVVISFSFSQSRAFVTFDYMKVEPANVDEYLNLEGEVWKPIHKAYQKNGFEVSWSLYRVRGSGTQNHYIYVTWENYTTFSMIDDSYNTDTFTRAVEKAHPDVDFSKVNEATVKSRNFLRSEIWELVDHIN